MGRLGISFGAATDIKLINLGYCLGGTSMPAQLARQAGAVPNLSADSLYLAALYNLADGKVGQADEHFAIIASRFPNYEPGAHSLGTDQNRRPFVDHELTDFRMKHPNFDFDSARNRLDMHQSRYRKGQSRNH